MFEAAESGMVPGMVLCDCRAKVEDAANRMSKLLNKNRRQWCTDTHTHNAYAKGQERTLMEFESKRSSMAAKLVTDRLVEFVDVDRREVGRSASLYL